MEEVEDGEEEGEEEEEEMEEGGDQEDKTLYCYCHSVSYGEVRDGINNIRGNVTGVCSVQMIGCDNEECEYQWVRGGVISTAGVLFTQALYSFVPFFAHSSTWSALD